MPLEPDITEIVMQTRPEPGSFGLCYECKADGHDDCIGVPCDCQCPGTRRVPVPDPKKLEVLEKVVRFEIHDTCLSCVSFWRRGEGPWGACQRFPSAHSKHTDGGRLSVRADGWCPSHERTPEDAADLDDSGFGRFLKKEKTDVRS